MDEYPPLRIAGIEPESFVDGPGIRLTVFTQGCHHNCPGCQNPQTHDFEGGHFIEREAIITMIKENPLLDGVTFSGGDPMDQAAALIPLAREIKERGLNLVIFTGYTYEQLMKLTRSEDLGTSALSMCKRALSKVMWSSTRFNWTRWRNTPTGNTIRKCEVRKRRFALRMSCPPPSGLCFFRLNSSTL